MTGNEGKLIGENGEAEMHAKRKSGGECMVHECK